MTPTANHIISSGSEASDSEDTKIVSSSESRVLRKKKNTSKSTRGQRYSSRSRRSSLATTRPMKHYVQHNYHDHLHDAAVSDNICNLQQSSSTLNPSSREHEEDHSSKQRRSAHRGGVATPFPEKLHFMLSQMGPLGTESIVSWQPHGRCFLVHKPKEFVEKIMPKFFRQSKMTSFQRQLNLYGFTRLTAGTDRGGYYHELFIRSRTELCKTMVRTRVKGNGNKAAASPSTEPNFYSMEPCPEGNSEGDSSKTEPKKNPTPIVDDHSSDDGLGISSDNEDDAGLCPLDDSYEAEMKEPSRSLSWVSLDKLHSKGTSTNYVPSAALVSPIEEEPKKVCGPNRKFDATLFAPPMHAFRSVSVSSSSLKLPLLPELEDSASLLLTPSDTNIETVPQSGDEVYFEGLPFHYLETKDVEGTLMVIGV